MTATHRTACAPLLAALVLFAGQGLGQTTGETVTPPKDAKAAAYYHYSMAHIYSELAEAWGNKGDYAAKAIEHYKAAIKADPSAAFLTEELSDLYIRSGQIRAAADEAEETLKRDPDNLAARRILGRIYTRMIGDQQQNKINEKMLKQAIEQYSKISEKDPTDTESWLMLGRLQKLAQNSADAEKAYKKVLDLDPDNEDATTGLAMVYSDLGDNKRATELLQKVAQKSPSMRTLTTLASMYEQMRDYQMAAETLKKTLDLSPDNLEVKKALAQDLLYSDQLDEAAKVYTQLAAEDPKDAQSSLRLSQIYRQQRKFDQAREWSTKAKEIEPSNIEVQYNDVSILDAEGKTTEAIALLKNILSDTAKKTYSLPEKNNRVLLMERLGTLYRSVEKVEPAVEAFRAISELDPDLSPRVSAQIIETYRLGKEFGKAQQESEAALKKYPDDRVLRQVYASVLAEVGKGPQAAAELKKLLDGKNDREIQLSLAQVYERTKNYPDMEKALDAADKLSESKDDKEAVAFMRAAMLEKQNKVEQAEAEFRKIIEANPQNASALNYLGYMMADRNIRLPEAKDMISKALELDPNNGAYLDSLGWVYFRMGKLDEAEGALRQAIDRTGKDPTVHDHLGDVFFKQGKTKEAIGQWEFAVREYENGSPNDNDPAEVAKIHKKLEGARVRLAKENAQPPKQP